MFLDEKSLIPVVREFVCLNQKQIIQYEFLVSEYHKKIKNFYISKIEHRENISEKDLIKLKNEYIDFILACYEMIVNVFNMNCEVICKFFKALQKENCPNLTITTIDGDVAIDIYKNYRDVNFNNIRIKEHVGLREIIYDNKKYYLNNSFKMNDEPTSSILIIPMSILQDEDDDELFVRHFFKDIPHSKDLRTIWGFLQFEYPESDYFDCDEDILVSIGYIIADILSLYLMHFYNHTTGSTTIKKITKIV